MPRVPRSFYFISSIPTSNLYLFLYLFVKDLTRKFSPRESRFVLPKPAISFWMGGRTYSTRSNPTFTIANTIDHQLCTFVIYNCFSRFWQCLFFVTSGTQIMLCSFPAICPSPSACRLLPKPQFLAFAALRAYPRQQLRKVCYALQTSALPLDHVAVQPTGWHPTVCSEQCNVRKRSPPVCHRIQIL